MVKGADLEAVFNKFRYQKLIVTVVVIVVVVFFKKQLK